MSHLISTGESDPEPVNRPRPIIVHYHFFKNAGTSLDKTLIDNFGTTWTNYEHPTGSPIFKHDLERHLTSNPWITVLSSHTALLPPPALPNSIVIPIFFLRHPIDRARSIYEFERLQTSDTEGARAAKEMNISDFVRWRLSRTSDRSIRNFQVHRLSAAGHGSTELQRSKNALSSLPFFGVVEEYTKSLSLLSKTLRRHFPQIALKNFHENFTSSRNSALAEKLSRFKSSLDESAYKTLIDANNDDYDIWRFAMSRYK